MASIVGRKVTVTSNNHGPIIAIATWFLMVAMTLAVIIRLAIKRFIRGSLSADDYTVSVSLVRLSRIPFFNFIFADLNFRFWASGR